MGLPVGELFESSLLGSIIVDGSIDGVCLGLSVTSSTVDGMDDGTLETFEL